MAAVPADCTATQSRRSDSAAQQDANDARAGPSPERTNMLVTAIHKSNPVRRNLALLVGVALLGAAGAAIADGGGGGSGNGSDCYDLKSTSNFTDHDLDPGPDGTNCNFCYKNCAGAWTRAFTPGKTYKNPPPSGSPTTLQCEQVPASWDAVLKVCTCHTGSGPTVTVTIVNQGPSSPC